MLVNIRALPRSALTDPVLGEDLCAESLPRSPNMWFWGELSSHSYCGPPFRLPLRIHLIADVDTSNKLWIGSHLMCSLWQQFVLSSMFIGLVCFPLSKQNVIKLGSTTLIPLPSAPIFLFPIHLITENVEANRSGRGKRHLARRLGSEVLGSPLQGQRTASVWEVGAWGTME